MPTPPGSWADRLADGSDGQSTPQRICLACVAALPVTGAAISLLTGTGQLTTVCASDDVAARIEELQFTVGVGPCLDAVHGGGPVLVRDLADTTDPVGVRWPVFAEAAMDSGVRAVFAFPLTIGAIVLGALGLYRDVAGLLTDDDLSQALLVADSAALALLDLRAATLPGPGAVPAQGRSLDGGAFHRTEVYQATGMIMIQLAVTVEVALVRLRAHAFSNDRSIGDVARDVVARRLHFTTDSS